jgi:hypothetical protein
MPNLSPCSHSCSVTNPAFPALGRPMPVGVLSRHFVTVGAIILPRVWMSRLVALVSNQLKMLWITAGTSFASVMKQFFTRDITIKKLVDDPMNIDRPFAPTDHAVTVNGDVTAPDSAARIRFWVNLLLQALGQRRQSDWYHAAPVWSKDCAGVNSFTGAEAG